MHISIRIYESHAKKVGYKMPSAFMSSKPGAGINHKVYGVTSEGVAVFLRRALLEVGINPDIDTFTVKLTGGPDGDVAGNAIKILAREYGNRCKIVGIADGSGCAEDPAGLNIEELLRLFTLSKPIAEYQIKLLSKNGVKYTLQDQDGIKMRGSMHNRVIADAFIPAGGRPGAINESNWSQFLQADGIPTSKIIVEGANLFLTPAARESLGKAGVLIVKDSSANKCGVICSSFEIIASMLLSEEEFLSIKERFIEEVLVKLKEFARLEADSLFREARFRPGRSIPQLCAELSHAITDATDILAKELATYKKSNDILVEVIFDHLPSTLHSFAKERLDMCIPKEYQIRMIASSLASKVIYQEGHEFLSVLSPSRQLQVAIEYFKAEKQISTLIQSVAASGIKDSVRIAKLLDSGGARALIFQE